MPALLCGAKKLVVKSFSDNVYLHPKYFAAAAVHVLMFLGLGRMKKKSNIVDGFLFSWSFFC